MDWKSLKYSFIGVQISMGGRFGGGENGPKALLKALEIPEALTYLTSVHILDQYKRGSKDQIDAVKSIGSEVALAIKTIIDNKKTPVTFGGDHSLSITTFASYLTQHQDELNEIGIIYIDAHPDFHTSLTSETQNIHGMVLAAACLPESGYIEEMRGYAAPKISPSSVCFMGIRSIDAAEADVIRQYNVFNRTSQDILKNGSPKCIKEAVLHLKNQGINKVIVSFDIDVLDPPLAPASGLPEEGGISVGDVLGIYEIINREFSVIAYEFVEFAPIRDTADKVTEKNYVEIIQKALGALN